MKNPRTAVRKGASICYPARVLLGNWCCQSSRRCIRVRWWNELLGQGIKLRKKLFQFPHTVIAHIAPGIQGCSFLICPALPQNAPAIRFRHLRLPWLLLRILSLLLIAGRSVVQLIWSVLLYFHGKKWIVSRHGEHVQSQAHFCHSHSADSSLPFPSPPLPSPLPIYSIVLYSIRTKLLPLSDPSSILKHPHSSPCALESSSVQPH